MTQSSRQGFSEQNSVWKDNHLEKVVVKFTPRKVHDGKPLKCGLQSISGLVLTGLIAGKCNDEDLYPGEYIFIPDNQHPQMKASGTNWLASGDLEFLGLRSQFCMFTPGPWSSYAKTVFHGNSRGYDVTAAGNHVVVASDLTEDDAMVMALVPDMVQLLQESANGTGPAWQKKRDEMLELLGAPYQAIF